MWKREDLLLVLWVDDNPKNNYRLASTINNLSDSVAVSYHFTSTQCLKQWFDRNYLAFRWISPHC